ncbi:MAG: hypothetical protein GY801_17650 [bacterium]|nr:hypothetical protein [bacterium]
MSVIQYLLDEHVDPRLKKAIKAFSPDTVVWRIGDSGAPSAGTLDPDILIWCKEHDFSLVTNNRASMPVHLRNHLLRGRHVPGIFILNVKMTVAETADEFVLIWGACEAEEYRDQLRYLPESL